MALTRIQIVNTALKLAQLDSSMQTDARGWLNIIISRLARDIDFPEFNQQAPIVNFVPGTRDYALPTDFDHADTVWIWQLSTPNIPVQQVRVQDTYRFDNNLYTSNNGLPNACYVNYQTGNLTFNINPGDNYYGYILRYFRKPADLSTTSADDSVVPDFLDREYLVQELVKYMHEFTDDERYEAKKAESKEKLREYRINSYQNDSTPQAPLEQFIYRMRVRY